MPRSCHADWVTPDTRPDPLALLEQQATSRVPELVPIRYGRMAASAFAFFRGAAAVMASDLAESPVSGIRVQLCGDAHVSNFGGFASPERDLVFDLNDFDETLPGPWEWDLKRLAVSAAIASRDRGWPKRAQRAIARHAAAQYRQSMRAFAGMSTLDVWYARMDEQEVVAQVREQRGEKAVAQFERTTAKARRKDSARAFAKLTHHVNGRPRIAPDPPLIVPVDELLPDGEAHAFEERMSGLIESYRATLQPDRRRLLEGFRYADLARKVVGVGSVGTRAWIVLMLGRDDDDPLFLQCKEAQASVLEPFAGAAEQANHGQRVVEGQRLMQSASDIFLGWIHTTGIDDVERDFYVRQLWDWKSSADLETMEQDAMANYTRLCAWTLARAHARSGDAIAIAAYLGSGDVFDRAIADYAEAYADQNDRDHAALVTAIDAGRLPCETGV
ncbi:MAG TPA: DUF2252 domain-containing protein [Conexibacter sp.]|nr:DUF2252 domain-containing protein [Conexibacter sp.]